MKTQQDDMIDAIAYRIYGATDGPTEAILAANPEIAEYGPLPPENIEIFLPDLPPPATPPIQPTLNLWD